MFFAVRENANYIECEYRSLVPGWTGLLFYAIQHRNIEYYGRAPPGKSSNSSVVTNEIISICRE